MPQIVQNSIDRRDEIFAASKYLAETLSYFALIDAHYRNQGVETDKNIDLVLLRVYSAILVFTAEVKKAQDESAVCKSIHDLMFQFFRVLSSLSCFG